MKILLKTSPILFFSFISLYLSCQGEAESSNALHKHEASTAISIQSKVSTSIIKDRIQAPASFYRINPDDSSFAYYLQNFPLKAVGSKVYYLILKGKSFGTFLLFLLLTICVENTR